MRVLIPLIAAALWAVPAAAQIRSEAYSASSTAGISSAPSSSGRSLDASTSQSIGSGASASPGSSATGGSLGSSNGGASLGLAAGFSRRQDQARSPSLKSSPTALGVTPGVAIGGANGLSVGPMYTQSTSPKAEVDPGGAAGAAARPARFAAFGGGSQLSGWIVCNRSRDPVLHVAVNAYGDSGWEKRGWYRVAQGSCVTVQPQITSRYAFYFAQGASGTRKGGNSFCADMVRPFVLRNERCPRGYQLVGFKRVEFGGGRSYTLNLR